MNPSLHNELNELSPTLRNWKVKEQAQDIPEGYFDSLPDQVMDKIMADSSDHNDKPAAKTVSIRRARWRAAGIAATVVGLGLMTTMFINRSQPVSPCGDDVLACLETLDKTDLESYLEENDTWEDEYEIISALDSGRTADIITPDAEIIKQETADIDDTVIDSYLDQNESILDETDEAEFNIPEDSELPDHI